ncbi:MAG TPA: M14 family zinc carboxypeptidase [Gemmatimonadales bacterium]|nr:M14 family zinc carboxypeptidase [Gemmatimonadales bacterium]
MRSPARLGLLLAGLVVVGAAGAAQQPRRRAPTSERPRATPAASRIPTPRSMLGFEPGDDRKLTDWSTLVHYYQALAKASDRVRYRELGKSTLGAPFVALVISSPQNLKHLDHFRELTARLADPRTARSGHDTQEALRDARTIALITSGIHSNEVGGHFAPLLLAYRLASDTSAATRAILDGVILWLVPSLNPDGVTILTRWYNRTLGTPAEGTEPPELYHHYAGHDNNRDWYAFTQVETQLVVDSIYDVWHPQVTLDIHQQDTDGSRLFLPPYLDPVEPNVDPLLVDGVNALGTALAWELAGQGKTGISINAIYDAWTPARAFQHYHGGVRILAEAASAKLASPVEVPFDQLAIRARGFNPRERSWNFTNPWPGGLWTLRDIVSYQTDAAYALLQHAARYRDRWLATFLAVGARAVRGWKGWPYAYVIPRTHQDTFGLATLLGILRRGQVEIRTALHPVTIGSQHFAAGSYVVVLRQPYAAFAKTLLEPQHYPDLRLYPGGPPLPPYDVTAHTLPLLMGVTAVVARDSLRIALSPPVEPAVAIPTRPTLATSGAPRIGLYRSYVNASEKGAMDEGWTRWVFDTWRVPYGTLVDSVVRAGKLRDKFDTIVLPDEEPHDLLEGLPREYPAPYAGGLGSEGVKALAQFVTAGGTLVALNDASRFAVTQLLLPVRNVLEAVPDDEFYAPGAIFRLELDTSHPLAHDMPAQSVAWYESGPAFEVLDSSAARVIGRYPVDPDRVLLSGWVLHPERVAGRAALVEVKQGAGRVVLFGFRPQYRGQSIATYPLLFNSLQLTTR